MVVPGFIIVRGRVPSPYGSSRKMGEAHVLNGSCLEISILGHVGPTSLAWRSPCLKAHRGGMCLVAEEILLWLFISILLEFIVYF